MSNYEKDGSEYSIAAVLKDGNVVDLYKPEFVGDGLETLDDAIDAARDAMEYSGKIVEVKVYRGVGYFSDLVGTYDADGWCSFE